MGKIGCSLLNQNTYLDFLKIMFYSTSHSLQFNRYYLHFLIKNLDKIFLIRKHTSNELIPITSSKIEKWFKKKICFDCSCEGASTALLCCGPRNSLRVHWFLPPFPHDRTTFFVANFEFQATYIPSIQCGYLIRRRSDVVAAL